MTQQPHNNNAGFELDWNDTILEDSEFVLLPDGLYQFTVANFERARHTPQNGGKLPACNKAILYLDISANEGETQLRHNLFLHKSTEGMISAFFGSIGQKKKGEPLNMNWNTIIGKTGICKVGTREYNGNKYNEVKGMIYAEDADYSKVLNAGMNQPQNNYAQPQQYAQPQASQGGYTPQGGYAQPTQPQQAPQQPQGGYTAYNPGQF